MNPPHFLLLVLPLTYWRPTLALSGWTLASITGVLLAARIVIRELGVPECPPRHLLYVLLYGVAWVGTGSLIVTGQLSWLMLWPLTASWSAMRRGKWTRSALLLGLLGSVKPFLLLLLAVFIIRRRGYALMTAVVGFASAFVVGLLVFGYDAHESWVRSLSTMNWAWAGMNASLMGFFARTLATSPQMVPLLLADHLVHPLWAVTSIAAVCLTLAAIARRPWDVDRAFALLLLAGLLSSPLGWVYYFWFLVPPFLGLARRRLTPRQPVLVAIAFFASLWPSLLVPSGQPSGLATFTLGSLYFWGLLSVWIALLRDLPRAGPASSDARLPP